MQSAKTKKVTINEIWTRLSLDNLSSPSLLIMALYKESRLYVNKKAKPSINAAASQTIIAMMFKNLGEKYVVLQVSRLVLPAARCFIRKSGTCRRRGSRRRRLQSSPGFSSGNSVALGICAL
jgi:hypothetical protein